MRERRLIRRLQQQDERAFRELVKRYQQPVYGFVYRMLGSREEAEDLAQEVFVTIFKSIGSFRGESQLSTWIYRIATNHCHNRHKYLTRRHQHATQTYDEVTRRGPENGPTPALPLQERMDRPDDVLEGKRLERALQRAMAALDEEHRALVILRDMEGLSYQEIASVTNLAEGTVKSRLHRARMALKDAMERAG